MRTKTIKYIHLSVLAIGFVIGFGFVPEVRDEFFEIAAVGNPNPKQIEPDTRPEPMPNRHQWIPNAVAILPKTKTKWK